MRNYLITGSTSGIGAEISRQLLSAGHTVVGLGRKHSKLKITSEAYHGHVVDFAKIAGLDAVYKALKKQYASIDAIICCAGMGRFAALEQFSAEQIQECFNVNVLSQILLIKTFLPQMKQQGGGKIILLGSEAALTGQKKGSLYCASKFALRGFSQSLRLECVSNDIAVSLINPGQVDTAFFDELDFEPAKAKENSITAKQIADIIQMILAMETNCVIEEVNCQQLKKVLQMKSVSAT